LNREPTRITDSKEYNRIHREVVKAKGKAKEYLCVDCEKDAMDWSCIKGSSGSHIDDFEPRCRSCHLRYDWTEDRSDGLRKLHKGRKRSQETIERIRASALSRPKYTQEYKDNMSKRTKGRVFSDDHKANLSKAQIGRVMPEETRKKISESLKKRNAK
jgi:hypothetical protein